MSTRTSCTELYQRWVYPEVWSRVGGVWLQDEYKDIMHRAVPKVRKFTQCELEFCPFGTFCALSVYE